MAKVLGGNDFQHQMDVDLMKEQLKRIFDEQLLEDYASSKSTTPENLVDALDESIQRTDVSRGCMSKESQQQALTICRNNDAVLTALSEQMLKVNENNPDSKFVTLGVIMDKPVGEGIATKGSDRNQSSVGAKPIGHAETYEFNVEFEADVIGLENGIPRLNIKANKVEPNMESNTVKFTGKDLTSTLEQCPHYHYLDGADATKPLDAAAKVAYQMRTSKDTFEGNYTVDYNPKTKSTEITQQGVGGIAMKAVYISPDADTSVILSREDSHAADARKAYIQTAVRADGVGGLTVVENRSGERIVRPEYTQYATDKGDTLQAAGYSDFGKVVSKMEACSNSITAEHIMSKQSYEHTVVGYDDKAQKPVYKGRTYETETPGGFVKSDVTKSRKVTTVDISQDKNVQQIMSQFGSDSQDSDYGKVNNGQQFG